MLEFYAERSPIFLAAVFDADAAAERGQAIGDGTPVHVTIPTDNPWVPLRILGLGKAGEERVDADVYLLTDRTPTLLPAPTVGNGMVLDHSAPASQSLLDDLRSDTGMGWVPTSAWLTKVRIDAAASQMAFDLAIDASGAAAPSRLMAGLERPDGTVPIVEPGRWTSRGWPSRWRSRSVGSAGSCSWPGAGRRSGTAERAATTVIDDDSVVDRAGSPWSAASRSPSGVTAIAAAWVGPARPGPCPWRLPIRYSHFERPAVTVQAGVPITIVLRNDDPIDHEWIVGDEGVHERHRNGTEPVHASRPTEVTIPAGSTRTTTISFATPGMYLYICHLPGHEAYGMVGTLVVTGG